MSIWSMIFTAIIILNTIGAIITVFKEKRDVAATWAWLLTLNLLSRQVAPKLAQREFVPARRDGSASFCQGHMSHSAADTR